jgi:hypothetical protein
MLLCCASAIAGSTGHCSTVQLQHTGCSDIDMPCYHLVDAGAGLLMWQIGGRFNMPDILNPPAG